MTLGSKLRCVRPAKEGTSEGTERCRRVVCSACGWPSCREGFGTSPSQGCEWHCWVGKVLAAWVGCLSHVAERWLTCRAPRAWFCAGREDPIFCGSSCGSKFGIPLPSPGWPVQPLQSIIYLANCWTPMRLTPFKALTSGNKETWSRPSRESPSRVAIRRGILWASHLSGYSIQ